ncbi:hypothetical protein [Streptomyces sp. NPDC002078]
MLNWADLEEVEEGLAVEVWRPKVNHEGPLGVPYGSNPATCPVRALRAWRQCLLDHGRQAAGPLFLRIDRHGRIAHPMHRNGQPIGDPTGRITGEGIGDAITRAAVRAHLMALAKVKEMEKAGETRGRGPAPALLVRHMEKIAATLPRNRFGIRDLSLMTLHFAIAGREHELAGLPAGARHRRGPRGPGARRGRPGVQGGPPRGRSAVRLPRPPVPGEGLAPLEGRAGRGRRPGQLRVPRGAQPL